MDFESNKFSDELTFGKRFSFFSLDKAQELFKFELSNIPFSYRLLLENLIYLCLSLTLQHPQYSYFGKIHHFE